MRGGSVVTLVTSILACIVLYLALYNREEIKLLKQENAALWAKVDSLQQPSKDTPRKQKKAPAQTKPATEKPATYQKVYVSSKYRLEDRYNTSRIYEPEFLGNEIGEVILNIYVDYSGDVKSAKLKSATGITNEDVIEACKKAALRTNFNYNSDKREQQLGTITYIFSAK